MRDAFRYLTSVLFVAVVVQVALAGYGAFYAVKKSSDDGSISNAAVDHGFNAHAVLGTVIVVLMLLLLIVALAGRLGRKYLHYAGGLFVLGILQFAFGALGAAVPALGFLHAVNALVIYAAAALLAHRAWTRRDAPAT